MRARQVGLAFVAFLAAGALLVGVSIGLWSAPRPWTGPGLSGLFGLFLGAVALFVVAVRSRVGPGADAEPAPWTDEGAVVDPAPEGTPDDVAVSGTALAGHVDAATSAARSAGDFRAGIERIRPPLRETLEAALVASGRERTTVERSIAEGSWTDDRLAAAVVAETVEPPARSFAERLRDWLFPERAVRRRTNRAVAAVDEAASVALPPVVGEDAPRTVPVVAPTLADLQRTADGHLQRAEAVGDGGWGRREFPPDGDEDDRAVSDRDRSNGASVPGETDRPGGADRSAGRAGGPDRSTDWDDVAEGVR
jgi:hypothetical protein